jgi:RNA polymerase sigma-70 factor (ECF subfamily)
VSGPTHRQAEPAAELIERARHGDGRAFEDLARSYEAPLYRHALRLMGSAAEAEDLVQDTFLAAWRSIGAFEGTSLRAWLFRIATNRGIDLIRSRQRRGESPLELEDEEGGPRLDPADPGPDLAELVSERELLAAVEAALRQLPDEQRAAVLLRDIEGFGYEEIAQITATELGTVKSRIHRGRLAVRTILVARGWRGPTDEETSPGRE